MIRIERLARLSTPQARTSRWSMLEAKTVIADKGYDADQRVIEPSRQAGQTLVIPLQRNCKTPRGQDRHLYSVRHLNGNFFCTLKPFRAIATRYDKADRNFLAAIYPASSLVWLN